MITERASIVSHERHVARSKEDLIQYAEWQHYETVDIAPEDDGKHTGKDCWCDPVQLHRASGVVLYIHREVH